MSKVLEGSRRDRESQIPREDSLEEEQLVAFRSWMVAHRGLMPRTLDDYCRVIGHLFSALGRDVTKYNAQSVRSFILHCAATHGGDQAQRMGAAVRAFLRYSAALGECKAELVQAVPAVASWRGASLPRYVAAAEVKRIVSACDRRTAVGRRDHAILLLLARLGLRAGDVSGLLLGDVDWELGGLLVDGKGRRQDRLPLPQDVGDGILGYLRRGRPLTDDEHVFIRSRPPWKGLTRCAISDIVDRAIRRAGVKAPFHGAHLLRHSLATKMVRDGASLSSIAKVLRHRSIETTAIYAKVDVALLRDVVQPWPEVTPW